MSSDIIRELTRTCSRTCEVEYINGATTGLEWFRRYDSDGQLLNGDPNTYVSTYHCKHCNAKWTVAEAGWPHTNERDITKW